MAAKSISLKIDVKGQDELFSAQKRVTQLSEAKKRLNKLYKDGKISTDAYNKSLAGNNVNLKAARTRVNQLNKSLLEQNKITKKQGSFTKKLSGNMMKMGLQVAAVVAGFKALSAAVSESIKAYGEQEQAETRLLTASKGNIEMQQSLIQSARELQQVSTFGDEEIIAQQAYLASLGMTELQINDVIKASMDLAVGTGQTLEFGVKNLAKTFGGLTGELGESLPMLKELTKEQLMAGEAVDVVSEAFEGQAAAVAATGTGPLKQLSNVFGDLKEEGGKVIMEFLTPFIQMIVKWLPTVPGLFRNIQKQVFSLYNWFVELYNESMGFRIIIESTKTTFTNMWVAVKEIVGFMVNSFTGLGDIIAGAFTLDMDRIKKGSQVVADEFTKSITNMVNDTETIFDVIAKSASKTAKKLVVTADDKDVVVGSYVDLANDINKATDNVKPKDPFKIDMDMLKRNHQIALNMEKENYVNGLIDKKEFDRRVQEEELAHLEIMKEFYVAYGKDISEIDGKILDKKIQNLKKEEGAVKTLDVTKLEAAAFVVESLGKLSDRRTERELRQLENQRELQIITDEQYIQQKEDLERKAFNKKKLLDSANVIINFATANSKTFSQLGFPAGLAAIPGLTGIMLAQLGLIAGQQFADGGLVGGGMFTGPSHAHGGVKFKSGGRLMEAEGGEAIINKRSTSMFRGTLSAINQVGGGVKFADGGILNGFNENFQMAGQFGGNRSEVVVVESSVTSSQNTVSNIQSIAAV